MKCCKEYDNFVDAMYWEDFGNDNGFNYCMYCGKLLEEDNEK